MTKQKRFKAISRLAAVLFVAAVFVIGVGGCGGGTTGTGITVNGNLKSSNGQPISQANVTVERPGTDQASFTTTDNNGDFSTRIGGSGDVLEFTVEKDGNTASDRVTGIDESASTLSYSMTLYDDGELEVVEREPSTPAENNEGQEANPAEENNNNEGNESVGNNPVATPRPTATPGQGGGTEVDPGPAAPDGDGDSVPDSEDNCPNNANESQNDADHDSVGDVCDNCLLFPNSNQSNSDGDQFGDGCDPCPQDASNSCSDPHDQDGDGMYDDPCPDDPLNICNDVGDPGDDGEADREDGGNEFVPD